MKYNKNSFIRWATETVNSTTASKYASHIAHLNKKYRFTLDGDIAKTKETLEKVNQLEAGKAVHHNFVSAWKKLIDWKVSASKQPTAEDITNMLAKNIANLVNNSATHGTIEHAISMSSKVLSELD